MVAHECVWLVRDAFGERRRKPRFADPGLTRDEHNLAVTLPGETLALPQEIDLSLAANKALFRQPDSLKAALNSRELLDGPRGEGLGKSLSFVLAEVAEPKELFEQILRLIDRLRPRPALE